MLMKRGKQGKQRSGCRPRLRKGLRITCEIVPASKPPKRTEGPKLSPEDRWKEIVEICAQVIAEVE